MMTKKSMPTKLALAIYTVVAILVLLGLAAISSCERQSKSEVKPVEITTPIPPAPERIDTPLAMIKQCQEQPDIIYCQSLCAEKPKLVWCRKK